MEYRPGVHGSTTLVLVYSSHNKTTIGDLCKVEMVDLSKENSFHFMVIQLSTVLGIHLDTSLNTSLNYHLGFLFTW